MIEIVGRDKCTGCSACHDICPVNCIEMKMDDEGFKQPVVNKDKCIGCNKCDGVCPALAIKEVETNIPYKAYAGWNRDKKVLMDSSSGGAFTAIAKKIINSGGIIFGAAFGEGFNVVYKGVDNINDIGELRRAKYLQSDAAEAYKKVKEALSNYSTVAFVGTPCQADGMVRFFGKKPDNLIVIEFICHGVPSRTVFEECNKNLEAKNKAAIKDYKFHSKERSWRSNTVHVEYDNEKRRELTSFDNPFMLGFFHNIILRRSCYKCTLKKRNRVSDIILADFWEINKINPELNRKDGVSMILALTEKGNDMIKSTEDAMELHEVDCAAVLDIKKHIDKCDYDITKREQFMDMWKEKCYNVAEKKFLVPPMYKKVLKRTKDEVLLKLGKR